MNPTFRGALAAVVLACVAGACGSTPPTQPPPVPLLTITCPPRVETASADGAPVSATIDPPVAAGGVGPIATSCTPPAGAGSFPGGTTAVTCTAIDSRGVSAVCTTAVHVRVPPRLTGNARFVTFGDSITWGVDSPPIRTLDPPPSFAYPEQLRRLLAGRYVLQRPEVINEGIPGEKAQDGGVRRFRSVLLQHRPDVVILMEGTNDTLDFGVGVDRAAAALRLMVQEAKQENVQVLLSTIIPERAGGARNRDPYVPWVLVLNDRIRALATEENVPLVDMYAVFAADMTLLGVDDLHPTQRGFEVMAETFFAAIQTHFEQPAPALR